MSIEYHQKTLQDLLREDVTIHIVMPYLFRQCVKCSRFMLPQHTLHGNRTCGRCLRALCTALLLPSARDVCCAKRGSDHDFHFVAPENEPLSHYLWRCAEHVQRFAKDREKHLRWPPACNCANLLANPRLVDEAVARRNQRIRYVIEQREIQEECDRAKRRKCGYY